MDLSIIFINYKTAEMTNDAINSVIEKSSGFSYEIIVVDNSNDASEFEKLKEIVGDKAKVIDAKANLGFGKGNNLGVENSTGDYILFLNTDTLLINNAIYELYNFIKNNESVGAVGPNLYTRDMQPNHSYSPYELNIRNVKKDNSLFSIIKRRFTKRKDFNFSNTSKEVDGYICGACLMLKREIFEKAGMFDKDIFMYGEDVLLCYNIKNTLKLKLYNLPSSKIIHFEGQSSDNNRVMSYKHAKMVVDGDFIYYKKVFGFDNAKKYLIGMRKIFKKKAFLAKVIFRKTRYSNYKNLEKAFKDKYFEIENKGENV